MVFHWSLSDCKFPQVFRTLLSNLAVLNNVVVWMVSTRLPISKSSIPLSNPLVTVPKAPITIGIIVTCIFDSFFQFPSNVVVLILLFTFFQFYPVVSQDSKVNNLTNSHFLLIIIIIIIYMFKLYKIFRFIYSSLHTSSWSSLPSSTDFPDSLSLSLSLSQCVPIIVSGRSSKLHLLSA